MKYVIVFLIICLFIPSAANAHYSQYVVYKSGAQSLPTSPLPSWNEPSIAYTAIAVPLPFSDFKEVGDSVRAAQVQVVWRAKSLWFDTGVAVLACPVQTHAEKGLLGCTQLAMFAANDAQGPAATTSGCVSNPGGPFPCRIDVTQALNSLINSGEDLYLTVATYGNGLNGPDLYDAELLVEWK